MENIDINQTRVSVGCRVTLEKKSELLVKAKEKGFNSLSQYLENLILNASNVPAVQNEDENLTTLTELDFDIIGEKINEALNNHTSKNPELNKNNKEDNSSLNDFLKRLSIINGGKDDEDHEIFIEMLTDKDLDFDTLVETFVDIEQIKEDANAELLLELIPVKFSIENKELILKYIDYLIENGFAKNGQDALIGSIYLGMEHKDGGFLGTEFPGRSEFLEAFEDQNKLNLK